MPCAHPEHFHEWQTIGELHIDRCEKYCAFCPPAKADKDWKFGWFLRRHVRNVHGKQFPNLIVSDQWGNDQPVARRRRAKTAPLDFVVAEVDTNSRLQPSMSEPVAMNVTLSLSDNVDDCFNSHVDLSGEVHDSNEFNFGNEINGDSFSLFNGVIDDFIMPNDNGNTESTALDFIDAKLLADINSINDMVPYDAVMPSVESIDGIIPYETIGQSFESIDEMAPYDAITQSIESIDQMIPYETVAQDFEAVENTAPYEAAVRQSVEATDYMLPDARIGQSYEAMDETPPYDEIVQSIEIDDDNVDYDEDDDDDDDDDDDEPFETIEPESEDAASTVSRESSMSSTIPPPTEEANALRQNIETAVMWAMESAMKQHEILNVLCGMVQEVAAW